MTDFALINDLTGEVVNIIALDPEKSRYKPPSGHTLMQVGDGYTTIKGWFWPDKAKDFIAPPGWIPDPNDDAPIERRKLVPPPAPKPIDPLAEIKTRLDRLEGKTGTLGIGR